MNMHGVIEPIVEQDGYKRSSLERFMDAIRRRRMFMLVVVLPTLIVAGYYYLIASDQYESEAHFLVHSAGRGTGGGTIGIGQALGLAGLGGGGGDEAMSVSDYLTSHDAVNTLRREDNLVGRFHDPDADFLSRLRLDNPTPETLLKYYRKQVRVEYDTETGITILRVRSFRPQDSFELTRKLLALGERRVNDLNVRSYNDSIAQSRRQLTETEDALTAMQARMTKFRQSSSDIDPQASGAAQIGLVTSLTGQLATARAQLNGMGGMINHSSPQYQALAKRVQALSAQVAAQSGRLVGSGDAIANDIGGYEELKMRRDFLGKRYEAAAAALQQAREQALRQQLYVVRVVDANLPVKSLYPERGRTLLTVFIALLLTYSIGWLIAAGVREHAA
jgi:capsular polysaccharide transport system permease protein